MPPFFDECPKTCHLLGKDREGKDYCEGCDLKIAKDFFEEAARAELDERVGEKWKQYKFDNLVDAVYNAFDLKDSDIPLTVTSEIMIGILISEQNKQRRIEDYNRKQKDKE